MSATVYDMLFKYVEEKPTVVPGEIETYPVYDFQYGTDIQADRPGGGSGSKGGKSSASPNQGGSNDTLIVY